ncbi:MAG: hypothetical protein WBK95_08310 [Sulfurimonas sp.]|nr:hypothetical protein [Sulfurimonas sp.]MDD3059396.1 hypothetical protein [Sulfurimonas sp.]MDD5203423.1 hypothetical protein [Sulfurimonas sp.]
MSKKILIITVFLSNIVFAAAVPVRASHNFVKNNTVQSLSSMATLNLHKRGLDKDLAQKKVADSLGENAAINNLMAQNITAGLETITHEDIVSYVSDAALYAKSVDLSSYGTLLSLVQKSTTLALEGATLQKIEKIALENQIIKYAYS